MYLNLLYVDGWETEVENVRSFESVRNWMIITFDDGSQTYINERVLKEVTPSLERASSGKDTTR